MSIWNGLTKEQEAFNEGVKHEREERKSTGAMVVHAFQEIGSNLTSTRQERKAHQEGHEHERKNSR